ncbi:MAG: hypothetical protein DI598_03650 [Pseudopedobacter saltans]|uniref:histidine kinase n=1 Tax=Pseudopedobacter saltans TaxID=151895 RepID=A0A2W5FAJ1_9SPHI|nr:MAG: hypothetical protein DI598_03650 [Pseudopedobacter saltans]
MKVNGVNMYVFRGIILKLELVSSRFLYLLGLLFSFFGGFLGVTDAQTLKFHHLNSENGLSQNSVLAIGQDKDGFIWLGTQNGLNRYDGFNIKSFYHQNADKNSLSSDYILSIFNDSRNRLWIGTTYGLNLYDPSTETFSSFYVPFQTENPRSNDINCILEDERQLLWIGTKAGLITLNPEKRQFTKVGLSFAPKDELHSINDLVIDRNRQIWLATSHGLFVLTRNGSNRLYIKQVHLPVSDKSNIFCTSIQKGIHDTYWIGTLNNGLFQVSIDGKIIDKLDFSSNLDNHIRKLLIGKDQNLFVASQNGLFVINQTTKTIETYRHKSNDPFTLGKNSLYSLFEDNGSSIWVGSFFGGVSTASKANSQFYTWPGLIQLPGIESPVISQMVLDKNNTIWMGTEGNGLIHFNPQNMQYQVFRNVNSSLHGDLIKSVYFDNAQQLWIGTHGSGVNVMNTQTKKITYYPIEKSESEEKRSETYCFIQNQRGQLLLGGNYGIKIADIHSGALDVSSIKNILKANCRTFIKLKNGKILAGTSSGLYEVLNSKLMPLYRELNINCLMELSDNEVLIGTGSGLYKYNLTTNKLNQIEIGQISKVTVLSIGKTSNNCIWISTETGLYNIILNNGKSVKQYLVGDGIANNQFNYNSTILDKNGFLYFGGNDGLTYFQQKDMASNENNSNIVFTSIDLLDTISKNNITRSNLNSTNTSITLEHNQASLTINFALLNFIKSDKNHYLYKLNGYDKNWRETKQPSATYINLPPGHYRLQIQGFNNDNKPSVIKELSIIIKPPFWKTWWAYATYFALFVMLILGITRYFFLKALYDKEEDLHKKKLSFFTNISHEIRTHLTLIIGPLTNLLQKENSLKGNITLNQVQNNASQLMDLVNELMDFRKIEDGALQLHLSETKIKPFVIKIYQSFLPIAEMNNIDFTYDIKNLESSVANIDALQMQKVIYNLLSNAFKFTPPNGKINISVRKEMKDIIVSIADNGTPINPIYREKIFDNYFQIQNDPIHNVSGLGIGLAYAKKIMELHKGEIYIQDTKDASFTKEFCIKITGISNALTENTISSNTNNISASRSKLFINEDEGSNKQYAENKLDLMIVEDNHKIQELLSDILSKEYNLTISDCAEDALKTLENRIPDIIISDIMMPGMGGIQFCKKIKQDLNTSHIPVILLTAKNTEEDLINGLENGADIYLSKPFNTQVLELTIGNILKRQTLLQNRISKSLELSEKYNDNIEISQNAEKLHDIETLTQQEQIFLLDLVQLVDDNLDNSELGVKLLTKEFAMSAPILYKKIQALTGNTIHEFIKLQRLKRACILLKEGIHNISEITYMVGYSDPKYFSKEFKKVHGVAPTQYQKG